jgi:hypothetical protein
MNELADLRRLLREREALAPAPAGIIAAARERGRRVRRVRRACTMAGAAATAAAALAAGVVITRPAAVGGLGHQSGRGAVSLAWGSGGLYDTGPITAVPVRTRRVPVVIPYTVQLPEGWRELSFAVQVGQFQARYVRVGAGGPQVVTMDIVPVAKNRRPTGDPHTGEPDEHGVLSWQAAIHYVRLSTAGPVDPLLYRRIAATLDFNRPRQLHAPITLGTLPAGSYVYAAAVTLPPGLTGYHPPEGWGAGVWVMIGGSAGAVLEPASFQVAFGPPYDDHAITSAALLKGLIRRAAADSADARLASTLHIAGEPSNPATWPVLLG